VISEERITTAAKNFHVADQAAIRAQQSFSRFARTAACGGFLAAILGGFLLYLPSDANEGLRTGLGIAQLLFLLISFIAAFTLFALKPYRTWRTQRASAEALRLQIFAHLISARPAPGEADGGFLLPLQLECFRRHLFDDQRNFFARRGPQHRRTVLVWKFVGTLAVGLILADVLPQALNFYKLGLLPESVANLIASIPLDTRGYALIGLIGGSLQGLLAALTVISPAERNAHAYKVMQNRLDDFAATDLDRVRAQAAGGDRDAVAKFAGDVGAELAKESSEWQILQAVLSEQMR
jgi:hypothetical protein